MIGRLVKDAMNLAGPIQYFVQTGWTILVSFEQLLLLFGSRAAESGVDRRVFCIFVVISMLVFVASWLAVAVFGFEGARVAIAIAAMSQPTVFSRAKAGHECGKGCHGLWLFLAEVSSEPLISDAVLEGREGFDVRTVNNLVLLNEEPGPKLPG